MAHQEIALGSGTSYEVSGPAKILTFDTPVTIDSALVDGGTTRRLTEVVFWSSSDLREVELRFDDGSGGEQRADLTDRFETNGSVTILLTGQNHIYTFNTNGAQRNEPYVYELPANFDDFFALIQGTNNLHQLVLRDAAVDGAHEPLNTEHPVPDDPNAQTIRLRAVDYGGGTGTGGVWAPEPEVRLHDVFAPTGTRRYLDEIALRSIGRVPQYQLILGISDGANDNTRADLSTAFETGGSIHLALDDGTAFDFDVSGDNAEPYLWTDPVFQHMYEALSHLHAQNATLTLRTTGAVHPAAGFDPAIWIGDQAYDVRIGDRELAVVHIGDTEYGG